MRSYDLFLKTTCAMGWLLTALTAYELVGVVSTAQTLSEKIKPEAINLAARATDAYAKKNVAEAIALYKQALAISPKYYNACFNLVVIYISQRDYKNAENQAKALIAVAGTSEAHLLLGKVYLAKSNLPQAEAAFNEAVRLSRKNFLAYEGLAEVYSKAGDVK